MATDRLAGRGRPASLFLPRLHLISIHRSRSGSAQTVRPSVRRFFSPLFLRALQVSNEAAAAAAKDLRSTSSRRKKFPKLSWAKLKRFRSFVGSFEMGREGGTGELRRAK